MQKILWELEGRKCSGLPELGKEVVREGFAEYLLYEWSSLVDELRMNIQERGDLVSKGMETYESMVTVVDDVCPVFCETKNIITRREKPFPELAFAS